MAHVRAGAALVVLVIVTACSRPRDPIVVGEGMLILENQTNREWRDVLITVNHHYRGGTPSLAPGGRLNAPLRDFRTGFGQNFDRGRMSVFYVVVTAKDADGKDVKLEWGRPR